MATIKSGNGKGKYRDANAKADVIAYITNPIKTPHSYIGGYGVDFNDPAASMNAVSASFGKSNGVQLRHFIISFDPRELSDYVAANIIADRCAKYISNRYQVVYAVHEDKPHIHIHFVFNSVSYVDGCRYGGHYNEFYDMRKHFKWIMMNFGVCYLDYVSYEA